MIALYEFGVRALPGCLVHLQDVASDGDWAEIAPRYARWCAQKYSAAVLAPQGPAHPPALAATGVSAFQELRAKRLGAGTTQGLSAGEVAASRAVHATCQVRARAEGVRGLTRMTVAQCTPKPKYGLHHSVAAMMCECSG